MGTIQKRWYEIRFIPSNQWLATGFTTDPTRDGLTKATAYKATFEYPSNKNGQIGNIATRSQNIWVNNASGSFYVNSNNITNFIAWGNTSNPNWNVGGLGIPGAYGWSIEALRLDELLDFEGVEIDPVLPITVEQVNNRRPTNRSILIDRKEWQEPNYVYTATGFINSQQAGQDGIIYREMMR